MVEFDTLMMKLLFCSLLCLSLLTLGCIDQKERPVADSYVDTIATIPDTIVEKSSLQYNHQQSIWTSGDVPFSGYAVQYFPNHQLKEKFAILNGKRQNEMTMWYPDGHLKTVATYDLGKLHGPKRIWSQDSGHVLIALYNYHRGKPHGAQKKWYPNGQLFNKLNLRHGQEE